MKIEDVELIMEETREAAEYQNVRKYFASVSFGIDVITTGFEPTTT